MGCLSSFLVLGVVGEGRGEIGILLILLKVGEGGL